MFSGCFCGGESLFGRRRLKLGQLLGDGNLGRSGGIGGGRGNQGRGGDRGGGGMVVGGKREERGDVCVRTRIVGGRLPVRV